MMTRHLQRLVIWLTALFLGAVIADAQDVSPRHSPNAVSLAGQMLVAAPKLRDPNFSQTVIVMIEHDSKGAFGLVINRRIGVGPLDKFLKGFGFQNVQSERDIAIHAGGPVERSVAFVLHSSDYNGPSARKVSDDVLLSGGSDVLDALAAGKGPQQFVFVMGYAGWGPGQLEGEMAREDWLRASANPALIFDDDVETKWDRTRRMVGIDL